MTLRPLLLNCAGRAQSLRGFAYLLLMGLKRWVKAYVYRENFSQREGMLIWPDFINFDTVLKADATGFLRLRPCARPACQNRRADRLA